MQHQADLALVKNLLKGDQRAFNGFYESYFPRVFRFCILRVPSEHVCQDIVQQTLSNAMRGLHTYKGEASLLTWLCQIGRNEIAKWYKANSDIEKNTLSFDHDIDLQASIESIPVDMSGNLAADEPVAYLVQTALDHLPTAYGDVLELKYIEGLSVQEIARHMNLGEIATQSLLARARKAFKETFSDLQADLSPAMGLRS